MAALLAYDMKNSAIRVCTCQDSSWFDQILFTTPDVDIPRIHTIAVVHCPTFFRDTPFIDDTHLVSRIFSESRPSYLHTAFKADPLLVSRILSTVNTITTVIIETDLSEYTPAVSFDTIAGTIRLVTVGYFTCDTTARLVAALLPTATCLRISVFPSTLTTPLLIAAPKPFCTALSITGTDIGPVDKFVASFPILNWLEISYAYMSSENVRRIHHPTVRHVHIRDMHMYEPFDTPVMQCPSVISNEPSDHQPANLYAAYPVNSHSWLCPAAFLLSINRLFSEIDPLVITACVINHVRVMDLLNPDWQYSFFSILAPWQTPHTLAGPPLSRPPPTLKPNSAANSLSTTYMPGRPRPFLPRRPQLLSLSLSLKTKCFFAESPSCQPPTSPAPPSFATAKTTTPNTKPSSALSPTLINTAIA